MIVAVSLNLLCRLCTQLPLYYCDIVYEPIVQIVHTTCMSLIYNCDCLKTNCADCAHDWHEFESMIVAVSSN